MSVVPLVSGGLDSAVMAVLLKERGIEQFPLFVDYGQLGAKKEWAACQSVFASKSLPKPALLNLSEYGKFYPSGLTDKSKDIFSEAFLPGRNSLFLLVGAAHACRNDADSVAIGLLDERHSVFPDQTRAFIRSAEAFLSTSLGTHVNVITPLMEFSKRDVVAMARELGISNTYSCHSGADNPCGICISCREFLGVEG